MSNRKSGMRKVVVLRQKTTRNPMNDGRRTGGSIIPKPNPLNNYQVTYSKSLRFSCGNPNGAATLTQVTFRNLLDLVLFCATATSVYDLFYMVRLKRVKVWCLTGSTSNSGLITGAVPASVSVIFDGITLGSQGDRKFHTDNSMGIEPAYLNVGPPKDSLASKFQNSNAGNAFLIELSGPSVVDVDLDFRSDVMGTAVAAQAVAVGATIGSIAFRGLDGLAVASSAYTVPIGINQV